MPLAVWPLAAACAPRPPRPPPPPRPPRPGPGCWAAVEGAGAAGALGAAVFCVNGGGAGCGARCAGALCTGSVACVCSCKSNVRRLSEAAASCCAGSNPNIAIENLHCVAGKPPISKRPSRSVTVVIRSLPHSAITVAPGIGCPPERTTPFCTAALPSVAENKTTHVKRSIHGPFCNWHNTRAGPCCHFYCRQSGC